MSDLTPTRSAGPATALWLFLALAMVCHAADTDIVINEIMYHPPLDLDELQYIELYNRGETSVDLSRWAFTRGIKFGFPDKTRLAAGGYLVICRNVAVFAANYGRNIPVTGDFSGRLSHHGEKLELRNASGEVVDAVKYGDSRPWPTGPDGYSASLERISPFVSAKDAANWAGSALPVMQKSAGTPGRRNDTFSRALPPVIANAVFPPPRPGKEVTVSADVADATGVQAVTLLWRTARTGEETREMEVPMVRSAGDDRRGAYQAVIPAQPPGRLVRFRLRAANVAGAVRLDPSPNEPRPTYSYSTFINTNSSRVPFAYVLNVSPPRRETEMRVWNQEAFQVPVAPTRGNGAFIYVPPEGGAVLTFDHVYVRPRGGGFKVHFQKDRSFKGMTGINVIFESSPRWILSEPMAYEVYRLAGIPACLTEHVRVWLDGRLLGYQLLIEQPNKAFLTRNGRNDSGTLYKLIWQNQGLTGQHEKKTRPASRYDDLIELHRGVTANTGPRQWEFIRQHFNVGEFINYYAVNMCIQNWDGFFNNYFLYHDSGDTGRWEMYPWDEDKTWGDYDGASANYDWYQMPLTYGMAGDRPPGGGGFFGGFGGGASWWRPPGWFSGPLLANPEFRKAFLARLGEICTNVFNEQKIVPLIDAMEQRLGPEIPVRAQVTGEDAREAMATFHRDIQSLRDQVKYRRRFLLAEIPRDKAAR